MLRYIKILLNSKFFVYIIIILGGILCGSYFTKNKAIAKFYNNTFAIKRISFSGMSNLSSAGLLKESGLKYGHSVFKLSVNQVKQNLEQMSWVKSAIVQRVIPSNINIFIEEKKPIAYWQNKDQLYLVDESGTLLPTSVVKSFPSLPISVGTNAEKAIPRFLNLIKHFPLIEQQIVFCSFLGNRRWNIQISRGLLIKLPEENVEGALNVLQRLGSRDGYFSADIAVIDLRVPGRVIISKRDIEKGNGKLSDS